MGGYEIRLLRLALAQINTTVGDFAGNVAKIKTSIDRARELAVDIIGFPEMCITGYPPEDLLLKPSFIEENLRRIQEVATYCRGLTAVVGFVDSRNDIFNAAAVLCNGQVRGVYHKAFLPNYGVFDEDRYFRPGVECPIFIINGVPVGVSICEDIWYPTGPASWQAHAGAQVIININASPYHAGKGWFRERMLATRAVDNAVIVAYVNLVGGQDELVFDGNSMVLNEKGELIARGKQFEEDLVVVDLDVAAVLRTRLHEPRQRKELAGRAKPDGLERVAVCEAMTPAPRLPLERHRVEPYGPDQEVYLALVLGTRDYVRKNGLQKVLIGLSGGIDSSLVATIAADALGPENVVGVSMPSRYSSPGSKTDAQALAQNLGIELKAIAIEDVFQSYERQLAPEFQGTQPGVAEENLQARIRGNLLMALSNKFGWLVLTTGNKSEMATGYTTLYGDMAGGFAVLKDVPKTLVYRLAIFRNQQAGRQIIPQSVLDKPPSAELRPGQLDTDSLPPYEVLDPILKAYVEEDWSVAEMVAAGFDEATVRRVVNLVDRSEYKRRQAQPGIKITPRAFGRDRRLPITNYFHL